jgi:hypothetical protein
MNPYIHLITALERKEEKAMTLVKGTRVRVDALINNLEAGDFVEIPYP